MCIAVRLLFVVGVAAAATCYSPSISSNTFQLLDRAIVETQRGCEVLCDVNSLCAGFAFQDKGFNSSCVLLKSNTNPNQIYSEKAPMFVKKTTGCAARSNITEEYGMDPCIDEMAPASFGDYRGDACTPEQHAKQFIMRVVTADGRRKSMGSAGRVFLMQADGMWNYVALSEEFTKVVAAVCASAGSTKCPCPGLPRIDIPGKKSGAVVLDRVNPCAPNAVLHTKEASGWKNVLQFNAVNTAQTIITCKAGAWYRWDSRERRMAPIEGAACV